MTKPPPFRPSRPSFKRAEFERTVAEADRDRIPAEELDAVLAAHRSECDAAQRRLTRGFLYLVWERYSGYCQRNRGRPTHDEILSEWVERIATTIEALRDNDLPASKIEGRIRAGLGHCEDEFLRDNSGRFGAERHISNDLKPDRTRGRRDLFQFEDREARETVDAIDDPFAELLEFIPVDPDELAEHDEDNPPPRTPIRRPSRYDQLTPVEQAIENERLKREPARLARERADELAEADRLAPFARSPSEHSAIAFIRDPSCLPSGISHDHIKRAIERLRDRADSAAGFALDAA